jgi:alkylated DNA repair dioxygenase AlkB
MQGLTYIQNYITQEEEFDLISEIIKRPWNETSNRRTQHYGFKAFSVSSKLESVDPIPDFLIDLKLRIERDTGNKFDQCVINEFKPGQGVLPHVDHIYLFDNMIVTVSLGSNANMIFSKGKIAEKIVLEKRSILMLEDEARYNFQKCIPALKSNIQNTRISITFRKVR